MKKMLTLDEARLAISRMNASAFGYDRETLLWYPEHGDPILAKDLTDSHLCNIINWIIDRPEQYDDGILGFMISEAEYRRLAAFSQNEVFIVINEEGRAEMVLPA